MHDAGQLTSTAARAYEELFVPALFGPWAPRMVAAARLAPGMHVVDVGCGTGVLALQAARAVSPGGTVVGIDLNPGMLEVARHKSRRIDWRQAPAEALPFEDGRFDAVVSQFALMFFADQRAALGQMWRVLRPGGRIAIAVWDSIDNAPGYQAVVSLLGRLFDDEVADLLKAPYSLGDEEALRSLLSGAGIADPEIQRVAGEARFASIRAWIESDVRGWTLGDMLDDAQGERLVAEAESTLQGFVRENGEVRFAHPALVAVATKT
jgi:ubiquinone/menaquinone biosynthesis C-methylase UbiE